MAFAPTKSIYMTAVKLNNLPVKVLSNQGFNGFSATKFETRSVNSKHFQEPSFYFYLDALDSDQISSIPLIFAMYLALLVVQTHENDLMLY